jgi:alpha-L-rhamnosidase
MTLPQLFSFIALLSVLAQSGALASSPFVAAKPVWPTGRSHEKNLQVGFRAVFNFSKGQRAILRLTASTLYRATVNGKFAGYGPARGPHGFYRVDELDITSLLQPEDNVVAVEVAGYNVNSYYTIDEPSFLQAEIIQGGKTLAATGGNGFQAAILRERVQKAQR